MNRIEIKNITKIYSKKEVLKGINATLEDNKIYGLLGRNGAGKTTLLNIITNRIFADEGEILINGVSSKENDKALSTIYFMSEPTLYPPSSKVKNLFKMTKRFYPQFDTEKANEMSYAYGLDTNKKIKQLSTGYRSIFKLILALNVNTDIIILDEPVLGLDAIHRDMFYKHLLILQKNTPKTIIISTHLIEEVSELIEEVLLIKTGELILQDSVNNVLNKGYTVTGAAQKVDEFVKDKQVLGCDTLGGIKSACVLGEIESAPDYLEITKLDLQKMFIHLTSTEKERIA